MVSGPPFFLVPGGPFHALTRRLGLVRGGAADVARLSLVFGFVPWLVLGLLALAERLTSGRWPGLVLAPSIHVRLLVAVPSFFLAERSLHVRTGRCIERIEHFVDETDERLGPAVRRAARWRDALGPELLLLSLVLTYLALTWSGLESLRLGIGISAESERSATVVWYSLVALPVFQFLGLRWLWHWAIWTVLLARLSTLRLQAIPSHPDRRGGLGFLAEPQVGFAYVLFGLSSVLASGTSVEASSFDSEAFGLRLMGLVLLGVAFALGPLLFFVGPLFRARFAGLRDYDRLAADYTSRFQRRWLGKAEREALLGTPDLQSLADLGTSCDVVRQMRLIPCTRDEFVVVVLAVWAPYLVLLLTELPFSELLAELANSLLGRRLL